MTDQPGASDRAAVEDTIEHEIVGYLGAHYGVDREEIICWRSRHWWAAGASWGIRPAPHGLRA